MEASELSRKLAETQKRLQDAEATIARLEKELQDANDVIRKLE